MCAYLNDQIQNKIVQNNIKMTQWSQNSRGRIVCRQRARKLRDYASIPSRDKRFLSSPKFQD
jgi:hypothetical protein